VQRREVVENDLKSFQMGGKRLSHREARSEFVVGVEFLKAGRRNR